MGGAEVGGPGTHLVFELGEAAYVVDPALLVEGGDGLGPDALAASGLDALVGQCAGDGGLEGGPDEVSARVVLGDDAGGAELVEEVDAAHRPALGGETAGLVGEDVGVLSVHVGSDYHDACLGAVGSRGHGGVYGDYDAGYGRVAGEPGFLYPLSLPECVFVFVDKLGVYLLAADACAVVLFDDAVEEGWGEVVFVVEGGASCDVYAWAVGEGIDELDGLGSCGDD